MTENGSLKVINPATEESIEEIEISSREDLDRAAERARRAFKEWRGVSGLERAELFHEIASSLRSHADEIAEIMTREGGKPFIENHDEVGWTAASFDYFVEIARDSVGYLPAPIEPQQLALVIKELIEGLPEGLLQALYGAGDVGEMVVRHPGMDMVAFTGSQQTGRKVGQVAAERLIRANLELGGKDPV